MTWIYPLALVLVIAANAVILGRRHLVLWLRRRRKPVEQCEVCGKWLRVNQVRELRSDADDDDEAMAEFGGAMGGGTAMIATYCRRHFPK